MEPTTATATATEPSRLGRRAEGGRERRRVVRIVFLTSAATIFLLAVGEIAYSEKILRRPPSRSWLNWVQRHASDVLPNASGTVPKIPFSPIPSRRFYVPSMHEACDRMFPVNNHFSELWNEMGPAILNTTIHHYATGHPADYSRIGRYRRWVRHLLKFYTAGRLRRSQAYPAPTESIRRILEVIQKRIQDPTTNEPVRILVMGGSVTAGQDCLLNQESNKKWLRMCAYPARLERLLNSVLFPGKRVTGNVSLYPVFEVKNKAVHATNSQVGAAILEHWLFPDLEWEPPHIVVSSYSANDARDDESDMFGVHQQDWVRAARSLRPCDDHLPLVVLADDEHANAHGSLLATSLTQTGSVYKTASWYDAMAVVYSNVVRHTSDYQSNFSEADGHPLYASGRRSKHHPGMGFHIGQAWTLFYNLAGAMHTACTEPPDPNHGNSIEADEGMEDDADTMTEGHDGRNGSISMENKMSFRQLTEPRTKYRGRYREDASQVLQEWTYNEAAEARRCGGKPVLNATATTVGRKVLRPRYSTRICVYAWMVSYASDVHNGRDVRMALEPVMTENEGWEAESGSKAGWYTSTSIGKKNAVFAIELRNISMEVDQITVLSLKSYGPKWAGSRLKIEVEVESPGAATTRFPRTAKYFVDGHHDKRTSVSYPHRFRLPAGEDTGGAAKAGDDIRARFTLVGGTEFKISGLAVCQSVG